MSPSALIGVDINAVVGGLLRDLAVAQSSEPKMFGYKRAAAAVLALPDPLSDLVTATGELSKIAGIGPASARVIHEVLETGGSPTVERAVDASGRRADIDRRRALRVHFLSRAEVFRVLRDLTLTGPTLSDYCGDLQMHSEWSDGSPSLEEISDACQRRGYLYAAVTDHSHGLKIAGGMSMAEAAEQGRRHRNPQRATSGLPAAPGHRSQHRRRRAAGLESGRSEHVRLVVVGRAGEFAASPQSEDQTDRLVTAVQNPAVRILAHPRGRITGTRAGIVADWPTVFAGAARAGVAIEIDGDPSRQDLDYTLAAPLHSRRVVACSRSTATHTPPLSWRTQKPLLRMRGWRASPPIGS